MKEVSPSNPADAIPFQAVEVAPGKRQLAYCGDTATIQLRLWGLDGTEVYDSETTEEGFLTMEIGESSIFYGLDRGMLGMRVGAIRTLIVPPAYLVGAEGQPQHEVLKLIPEGQVAIVDVELIKLSSN